jgi:hypothetical protein
VRLARVVQPLLLGDIHQGALPVLHRSLQYYLLFPTSAFAALRRSS